MSQSGSLSHGGSGPVPPTVPESFVTDSGIAIPVANILNVNGAGYLLTNGSGNTVHITAVNPVYPSFNAYSTTGGINNVTGDGTVYLCQFNSRYYDYANNFSVVTNYFTAPVNGVYLFTANIGINGLLNTHTDYELGFYSPDHTPTWQNFTVNPFNVGNNAGYLFTSISLTTILSVGQRMGVNFFVNNGTKVISFLGGNTQTSSFSGHLLHQTS